MVTQNSKASAGDNNRSRVGLTVAVHYSKQFGYWGKAQRTAKTVAGNVARAVFYYWVDNRFHSLQRWLQDNRPFQSQLTSALKSLNEVSVPDQKAIAHILGTLDDKIELNQKMNQTLEEIAKAIFKSWFVDFDPVRAKAEGRPTGLPRNQ